MGYYSKHISQWQLTSINPVDINPIMEIERRSFAWPWNRLSFLGELASRHAYSYMVKLSDNKYAEKVIAYIFFRQVKEELHILKIAVTPHWRSKGIASKLLKKCFTSGLKRGARSAFLEVRPSNASAMALYRKKGFRLIGRKPNYYTDTREDALVLMKNLKEDV
jgi:ribosomal-protein-alanine N-acetyltransferase